MENAPVNSPRASRIAGAPRPATGVKAPPDRPTRLADWAGQYRQLREQGEQLEAACTAQAGGKDARVQAAALHQLRVQLAKQLSSVAAQLQGLRAACQQPGSLPLQGLERRLAEFEGSLSGLQGLCATRLEELARKEAAAATELEAASRSLQAALCTSATPGPEQAEPTAAPKPERSAPAPPRQPEARPSAQQQELPPEVRAYDAFLQQHGPTGGWHPDDHDEFERILRACRGIYSHAVQISTEQLGLLHTREDIIRHARWHEELQDLQQRKREAIQQWRVQRAARQAALLEQQRQQEGERAAEPSTAHNSLKSSEAAAQQREQQRLAVLEWKRSKEERQRMQRLKEQEEAREQRERERQAQEARRQELAAAVAGFRQHKAEQYQQRALAAERPPSSRLPTPDPEAQRRVVERSQQLLAKRQGLAGRRTADAQEREARLRRLQAQASAEFAAVEREPGRVLQPTAAAQQRQLAAAAEERSDGSGWIRHVQHKATPSWCRGA